MSEKIPSESIMLLNKIVETCLLAGIGNAVVESGKYVRGINDDHTCLIVSEDSIPFFGKNIQLGLSRLPSLKSHLGLLAGNEFGISFDMSSKNENEISVLHLNNKKTKTQFRCASPSIIKAPKGVGDKEFAVVELDKDDVQAISVGSKAIGSKDFTLLCKKEGDKYPVYVEVNNPQDNFSIKISDNIQFVDEPETFVHYYAIDNFISLAKYISNSLPENERTFSLIVGSVGTLRLIINNHVIILIPKKDNQE